MSNHRHGKYDHDALERKLAAVPREQLLQFCYWNDRNGNFEEADTDELREIVLGWCNENQETPNEIIDLSRIGHLYRGRRF